MTWKGKKAIVRVLEGTYETGVKTSKREMEKLEKKITRLQDLGKWSVDISPEIV